MATTTALYRNPAHPVKFNREFLERRMNEHRKEQQRLASYYAKEIVREVIGAWGTFQRRKTARIK